MRSALDKVPKKKLLKALNESGSRKEALTKLGFTPQAWYYRKLEDRALREGFSIPEYEPNYAKMVELSKKKTKPLKDVLVKGSTYSRGCLKARLIDEEILLNECAICGQGPIWNGKPLVMILDHKNGISDDHELQNLRLVCPNCNIQLPTHAGKNTKKKKRKRFCPDCGVKVSSYKTSGFCRSCSTRCQSRKEKPVEEVRRYFNQNGIKATVEKYGLSKTTIYRWLSNERERVSVKQGMASD